MYTAQQGAQQIALQSQTQRNFQATHAHLLGPSSLRTTTDTPTHRNGSVTPGARPHQVTQRSVDRSWASLTSPLKTMGFTPSVYSAHVQRDFLETSEAKRLRDLATSTESIRATAQKVQQRQARQERGGKGGIPRAQTAKLSLTGHAQSRASNANRPAKLEKPVRNFPGVRQRYNYASHSGAGYEQPLPNPAVDPPLSQAELLRSFPWSSRESHHWHELNPRGRFGDPPGVDLGYYTSQWDDRFNRTNPYQQYEVEVVNTSRPRPAHSGVAGAQGEPAPAVGLRAGDVTGRTFAATLGPQGVSPPPRNPLAATSLGFGNRHESYRDYLHHTLPSDFAADPAGPVARAAGTQNKILMEVAPHLVAHMPASAVQGPDGETKEEAAPAALALAVPYKLARFVPVRCVHTHRVVSTLVAVCLLHLTVRCCVSAFCASLLLRADGSS